MALWINIRVDILDKSLIPFAGRRTYQRTMILNTSRKAKGFLEERNVNVFALNISGIMNREGN